MKIIQLITAIIIAQCAGLIGSLFTAPAIPTWYAQLNKPEFNPPDGVFGPVWLVLYTLMGLSSYLVWQKRATNPIAGRAIVVYAVHLVFNALWSVLFFGLKNPGLALVEIILLWALILAVIVLFFRAERLAAYLMIPYLLWVSFAVGLNYSIWRLN